MFRLDCSRIFRLAVPFSSESRRELAIFDQTHVKEHTKYVAKWRLPRVGEIEPWGSFGIQKE